MAHAVRLTPDALRQVRSGHPWVYDGSIRSGPTDARAGDLAVIFDDKRKFAAIGFWDPDNPIRLRVLHRGKPVEIGPEFFVEKIAASLARRSAIDADPATTGWRAVHGENDGLPGLVIDRYGTTAVIKLDTAAWLPWLNEVLRAMTTLWAPENVVLRTSRHVAGASDGSILHGDVPNGGVVFQENGLRFVADVIDGNKTGHFLDQRDNRALVQGLAQGRDVLDVFCSSGGFSVYAAAGGATSVTSVDISKAALAACRIHMASNAPEVAHTTESGDAFEVLDSLRDLGRQFGVVVVDPPSFASKAADVSGALRAYAKLTTKALAVLQPGGVLVQASCSSRVDADGFFSRVSESAASVGRPITELHRTFHAEDHPIGFPQGGYLKALFGTA